MVKIFIFVK